MIRAVCFLSCLLLAPPAWSQASAPRAVRYTLPRGLEARLSWARGDVSLWSADGGRRPARDGEVLTRGLRVRVGRGGGAEVALRNGATIELMERTQVVMFASSAEDAPDRPPLTTTTLRFGTLRFRAGPRPPGAPALVAVATSAAVVYLGRGDGELTADEGGHMTRIAVHRGRAPVTTERGSFVVRAGHGAVQRGAQRPRPEVALPAAPRWLIPPPERVVSGGGPVDVSCMYALPRGRPERWRVELARDPSFRERVSTHVLPGRTDLWIARDLTPGRYYARVAALDEDALAGLPSPVASWTVAAPTVLRGRAASGEDRGRPSLVAMPRGFYCSLDGMALTSADAPLRLEPARPHGLRCAPTPDGRRAREYTIDGAAAGPLGHEVRLYTGAGGDGVLGVTLRGGDGAPVPYADVRVESPDGLAVGSVREADARGDYTAAVRWPEGATRARLRFTVNGVERFEETVSRE